MGMSHTAPRAPVRCVDCAACSLARAACTDPAGTNYGRALTTPARPIACSAFAPWRSTRAARRASFPFSDR